ncbi:MAG: glycosyltransferase [Rhodobacteraceae bacterium]|nr:glycosyltransferase [Paracoccaceae bacterium]NNK67457.1 glycosyltransferase [Paracoccaceae bacterium]
MTRISVITVTYNLIEAGRADMFRQAVASVRAQSHGDVEHILVDGASTDGTDALIAQEVALGGIARVISEPDRGVYDAMNKGAAAATGDWILFLNSDDFYHRSDGLAAVADVPGAADFVASPVIRQDGTTSEIAGVSRGFARVLITMPFSHQGLAMRRGLFADLSGFDPAFRVAADYDLVLRMFLSGARGHVLPGAFATFRTGGLSADTTGLKQDQLAIWRKNLGHFATVPDDVWTAAQGRRTLPRSTLAAMAQSPDLTPHLRRLAAFQRARNWLRGAP